MSKLRLWVRASLFVALASVPALFVACSADIKSASKGSGIYASSSGSPGWQQQWEASGSASQFNTETYDRVVDNAFLSVANSPRSTFAIDVDTASYSNVRRFLNQGKLPPADAVRIEEMVNYFPYHYPAPEGRVPFATHHEVSACPWNEEHKLVRIGLKGKQVSPSDRPSLNLVFLIDVSGSMAAHNRLPLVKKALTLLVQQLQKRDRVAIVVYAGRSGLELPATSGDRKEAILEVIHGLEANGSTNGGEGIQLAYRVAGQNFMEDGSNRVILCTDGDFNVGITSQGELLRLIEQKAKSNISLSVLGFGMGNLKDSTLEKLADKGHGNYAYIDSLAEATKVLVDQMTGTLITIAKDVKIQVEFNPGRVLAYRLLGYENRLLHTEDFKDDTKMGGDIGAGHTVTAFYEVVPVGKKINLPGVDELKYQAPGRPRDAAATDELLTIKLRYKEPQGEISRELEHIVQDADTGFETASRDHRFAAAVAALGMILRDSPYRGDTRLSWVLETAAAAAVEEKHRLEFLDLVKEARRLKD